MLGKLVVIGIIAGAAYWYWSGPYQQNRPGSAEQQLQENARLMKNCQRQEKSMSGSAGLGGVLIDTGDVESLCAEKLGLYLQDGQWYRRGD